MLSVLVLLILSVKNGCCAVSRPSRSQITGNLTEKASVLLILNLTCSTRTSPETPINFDYKFEESLKFKFWFLKSKYSNGQQECEEVWWISGSVMIIFTMENFDACRGSSWEGGKQRGPNLWALKLKAAFCFIWKQERGLWWITVISVLIR